MQVRQGDDLSAEKVGLSYRAGSVGFTYLAEGTPGTRDNFSFIIGRAGSDLFSPRHRHNFEQLRFQISGVQDFGREGKMKPGMLGYFPEAVPYGPQTADGPNATAVLQFGGASGSGYLSQEQVIAATEELRKLGTFEQGHFHPREDAEGRSKIDGFQAIWEFINKRALRYPKPRYFAPVMMEPSNYSWIPVEGYPGVKTKLLGIFTEARTEAAMFKLAPGAKYTLNGRAVHLFLSGTGTIEREQYRYLTSAYLSEGETAAICASEETEVLRLGLPHLEALSFNGDGEAVETAGEQELALS